MVFVHIQRYCELEFSENVIVYSFEFVDGYIFMHFWIFYFFCIKYFKNPKAIQTHTCIMCRIKDQYF